MQSIGACFTKMAWSVISFSFKEMHLMVKFSSYPGISFSIITILEVKVFPSFVTLVEAGKISHSIVQPRLNIGSITKNSSNLNDFPGP